MGTSKSLLLREHSIPFARSLGLEPPDHLPIVENLTLKKSLNEIVERVGVLNVIVAVSFGFPAENGRDWIDRFLHVEALTSAELAFLGGGRDGRSQKANVECLWVLTWVLLLSLHPSSSHFAAPFPFYRPFGKTLSVSPSLAHSPCLSASSSHHPFPLALPFHFTDRSVKPPCRSIITRLLATTLRHSGAFRCCPRSVGQMCQKGA